jgi:hypothetical protein
MPQSGTTSAGVYDSAGRLIRTLWSGEALAPGEYVRFWDKADDSGRVASPGKYEVRLIIHRLSYVWEGVVGNSSGVFVGPQVHKAYQPPTSITISGEHAYYAVGYNEGQTGIHGFQLSTPQFDTHPIELVDPFAGMSMVSADATRIYWANTGGFSHSSFVAAFDLATGQLSNFAAGARVCLNTRPDSGDRCFADYPSVIDVATDASAVPTGLAVQSRGRVLAVAHGGQDRIRLYDKLSGASIGEIAVPLTPKGLNQLAMSPGGDLWVISGRSLIRFTDLENGPTPVATVTGLTRPLAVAVSPANDDTVWVADGGASQQLKRLDRNGVVQAIVGVAGGYGTDPVVADSKLCFQGPGGHEQTAVAVAADESIWVVDYCNDRMLRFRPDGQRDAEVAYLPAVYASTVDHGSPTRVFANYLEFEVDYAAPLAPGKSWKLVRNWLIGLPAALQDPQNGNGGFAGFRTVETLSNGRTYGLLSAPQGGQAIVELPRSGPVRLIKVLPKPGPHETPLVMYENGDLGYSLTWNAVQSVIRLPLSGFAATGDPVWSSRPQQLAAVPTLLGTPYYRGAFSGVIGPRFPVTESGNVIFFDQSVTGNEGFHLGAAAIDGDTWLWQASPTGPLDGRGAFQTKSIDTSINYGGNAVWSSGRHVVYGFHGEFYTDLSNHKVGQANQFLHYYDDGLFIGQFGLPSTRTTIPSASGLSGNAFSPTLVRVGDQLYLYHNDESSHGGVHRWRFDGWQDLKELRLPLQR